MGIFFKIFMKFVVAITNFVLLPINTLIVNIFPDFTDMINHFEALVGRFITPLLGWFYYLLPPYTRGLIIFYLELLLTLMVITLSVHAVLKVFHIIKNIKFW